MFAGKRELQSTSPEISSVSGLALVRPSSSPTLRDDRSPAARAGSSRIRNRAAACEQPQITGRYFARRIGKAQRVNGMSARQRTERGRRSGKKKRPRAGRACIFDNYSTVDLRADGLRTEGRRGGDGGGGGGRWKRGIGGSGGGGGGRGRGGGGSSR